MFYMRSKIYFVNNHYYLKYANDKTWEIYIKILFWLYSNIFFYTI